MKYELLLAGAFFVPTLLTVIGLKLAERTIRWAPILWAAFAYLLYLVLLKSRTVLPVPALLQDLPLIWYGKILTISGTLVLIYFIPGVRYRDVGLTLSQREGSLIPVAITAVITIVCATATSFIFTYSPNTTLENILFQATLAGMDEELFFRGLLLLLLHQAFAKTFRIFDAETGWGFWIVVLVFGLLHGVAANDDGSVAIRIGAMVSTGFTGFILTWMRERTGSLVAPILFHNTFNVAMAFV